MDGRAADALVLAHAELDRGRTFEICALAEELQLTRGLAHRLDAFVHLAAKRLVARRLDRLDAAVLPMKTPFQQIVQALCGRLALATRDRPIP